MKQLIIIITFFSFGNLQAQWYPVNSNTTENIKDIFMVDSLNGYCVGGGDNGFPQGNGVVLHTTDGGNTFNLLYSDTISAMEFVIYWNNTLFVFAKQNNTPVLFTFNNNFGNFNLDSIAYSPTQLKLYNNQLYFVDKNDFKLKVMDSITSSIVVIANDIVIFDISSFGIVTVNQNADIIKKSIDNGATWINCNPHPIQFNSNCLLNSQIKKFNDIIIIYNTYCVGTLYSIDNGNTWGFSNLPIYAPFMFNPNKIYGIRKYNGKENIGIWTYQNQSIHNQYISIEIGLNNIYFYNERLGFVFGKNGQILKTLNGGGLVGLNEVQSNKKIKIFPNPTNNILQIEYANNTTIKNLELFDLKGVLIRKYSNEFLVLDISNIPSGEYVLLIQTKAEKITKKVLIVR